MKYDTFLRKHPVFTGNDLEKYLSSVGRVGPRNREAILAHCQRAGRTVRVRRGLYAAIPPGTDPDSYPIDPLLVAARLTWDAVLSHHTALEFHGRAYSVRNHFVYSSSDPLGSLTFRSHVFRGAKFPQALRLSGKENFGVLTAERSGGELRVTSLERTLVDVLNRPDLSGSWEEIWRSLESIEFFDLDRVLEYTRLLGSATTGAKVGFFLEQHREFLMVDHSHLEALRDLRPRQPHYLDRARRKPGRLVSEWNLVVSQDVLDRAWGEVP